VTDYPPRLPNVNFNPRSIVWIVALFIGGLLIVVLFQGLEFASDRGSFEGLPYYNSKAIGNRSKAAEEKSGSARLESKRSVKAGVNSRP
jgi:hypothetical protein